MAFSANSHGFRVPNYCSQQRDRDVFPRGVTKRIIAMLLVDSLASLNLLAAKKSGMNYTMKYEDGSLPFKQHRKLKG